MRKTQIEAKQREEGRTYPTRTHGDVVITEYVSFREVYVKFLNTGYEKVTTMPYIRKGSLADNSQIRVHGVGIFEKGEHPGHIGKTVTPAYRSWAQMLGRCYNESWDKYPRYGGRGVTVCPEWLIFQNFASWYNPRYRNGYELDKDILSQGNKTYSPHTCCLVPPEINQLVIYKAKASGLPTGVEKKKSKFYTCMDVNGVRERLGSYKTQEEAFEVYKNAKESFIQKVAQEYYDNGEISKDVYDALMCWEIIAYPDRSRGTDETSKSN